MFYIICLKYSVTDHFGVSKIYMNAKGFTVWSNKCKVLQNIHLYKMSLIPNTMNNNVKF